ncbi:MAG: hypothetical protein HYV09_19175 [Deltaproteobacteria bacterium]|nr:hypothetical protein [Deltaproteobacteria bacterium]
MIHTQPTTEPQRASLGSADLDATLLRLAIGQAVQAPSSHNTQPWRFHVDRRRVDVWADGSRLLPVVDPYGRELVMSCGAALSFLVIALRRHGYAAHVERMPDARAPELLARVSLAERVVPTEDEIALCNAIDARRTNRGPFAARPVPIASLISLRGAAEIDGVWVDAVQDKARRHLLAELIAEGDRAQWEDPAFRDELARWLRSNRQQGAGDGIPGYALGMGDLASQIGPFVVRTFDRGDGEAARDLELAEGAPVLAVLGTLRDRPIDWLYAGEALGRALLRATVLGLSASFLNQAIEVGELRPRVARVVGIDGTPQVVVRVGFAETDVRPTPRRPVEDVLF